jgi:hypothetical protein
MNIINELAELGALTIIGSRRLDENTLKYEKNMTDEEKLNADWRIIPTEFEITQSTGPQPLGQVNRQLSLEELKLLQQNTDNEIAQNLLHTGNEAEMTLIAAGEQESGLPWTSWTERPESSMSVIEQLAARNIPPPTIDVEETIDGMKVTKTYFNRPEAIELLKDYKEGDLLPTIEPHTVKPYDITTPLSGAMIRDVDRRKAAGEFEGVVGQMKGFGMNLSAHAMTSPENLAFNIIKQQQAPDLFLGTMSIAFGTLRGLKRGVWDADIGGVGDTSFGRFNIRRFQRPDFDAQDFQPIDAAIPFIGLTIAEEASARYYAGETRDASAVEQLGAITGAAFGEAITGFGIGKLLGYSFRLSKGLVGAGGKLGRKVPIVGKPAVSGIGRVGGTVKLGVYKTGGLAAKPFEGIGWVIGKTVDPGWIGRKANLEDVIAGRAKHVGESMDVGFIGQAGRKLGMGLPDFGIERSLLKSRFLKKYDFANIALQGSAKGGFADRPSVFLTPEQILADTPRGFRTRLQYDWNISYKPNQYPMIFRQILPDIEAAKVKGKTVSTPDTVSQRWKETTLRDIPEMTRENIFAAQTILDKTPTRIPDGMMQFPGEMFWNRPLEPTVKFRAKDIRPGTSQATESRPRLLREDGLSYKSLIPKEDFNLRYLEQRIKIKPNLGKKFDPNTRTGRKNLAEVQDSLDFAKRDVSQEYLLNTQKMRNYLNVIDMTPPPNRTFKTRAEYVEKVLLPARNAPRSTRFPSFLLSLTENSPMDLIGSYQI